MLHASFGRWIYAYLAAALFWFVLIGLAGTPAFGATPDKPMNVLFIMADDLNTDLGSYGHPLVKTPNLDRLADRGVRFNRAYCQYPLCGPSRVSLFSGQRPNATKVYVNEVDMRWALPDVVTLPQLFQRHGYRSMRVGKLFHGNPFGDKSLDDAASWDEVRNFDRAAIDRELAQITAKYGRYRGAGALDWVESTTADDEMPEGQIATAAIQILRENRDRPFFLGVGFFLPHTPWIAPKKYFDSIAVDRVQPVVPTAEELASIPVATRGKDDSEGFTLGERQEAIRGYYAGIQHMDTQVGRVLDELEKLGLASRTLVVFVSDHGYQLGHHGMWHKFGLFEQTLRVPLIIHDPRRRGQGRVSDRVVESVDIYPTVAALAGLSAPPSALHGRSLTPLLADPTAEWDHSAYAMHQPVNKKGIVGRSVIHGDWHYFEWNGGEFYRALFNLRTDPAELHNLVDDPAHAATIQRLRSLLAAEAAAVPPDPKAIAAQANFPPKFEIVRRLNAPGSTPH